MAALALLASDAKHVRFEVPNEEFYAPMLKVFHELLEHWASTAATVQAVRPGARPRDLLVLELKISARTPKDNR